MIVLNAAVAYQLTKFKKDVDVIIKKGINKDEAIFQVLKKYILESERVLFEGDNYSKEWHQEAKRRGLCNITSVPESISLYLSKGSREMLVGTGILQTKNSKAVLKLNMRSLQRKSRSKHGYWAILQSIILFLLR